MNFLKESPESLPSASEIAALCHRHTGFGADGFVILKPHPSYDFEWMFFNSDGSPAEMCGNAARAVSQYYAFLSQKSRFAFLTKIGPIQAIVEKPGDLSGEVHVLLPLWTEYVENRPFSAGKFTFVNTGVPHAVISVDTLSPLEDLKKQALQVKALPEFLKKGVNVTFKSFQDAGKIQSVTFERGVENFTLSCGTGAIAAAIAQARGKTPFELIVQVPGGVLWVNSTEKEVRLKGEGRIIGSCSLGVTHESQS